MKKNEASEAQNKDSDCLIRLKNLHFSRGEKTILDGISLDIVRGKVTAIMGPSGSGKTTLLGLIGGQLKPDSGSIEIDGQDVCKMSRKQLYAYRRRIGMLFQAGALFTDLSVFENIAFPLREHTNLSEDIIHDLVLMKLQAVGLRGTERLQTSELSGGMARRVALARAMILDPEVMMYDEPFTGQDPITKGVLLKLIRDVNKDLNITTIIVSHDVIETAQIADYMCVMAGGRLLGCSSTNDIMQEQSPELKQFLHGLPDGPVPFKYNAKTTIEQDLGFTDANS